MVQSLVITWKKRKFAAGNHFFITEERVWIK